MNSHIDTDHSAIQQNNAGVNCYIAIGDTDGALHYFRQALAAKLASENRFVATTESSEEKNLHNLDSYTIEVPDVAIKQSQHRCISPDSTDFFTSNQLEVHATGVTGTSIQSLCSIA